MKTTRSNMRLIGRREFTSLPLLGIFNTEAKIDTGAYTTSVHCENIKVDYENSKPILYFTIMPGSDAASTLRFEAFTQKKIKNSFGEMEERFVIRTVVHIGRKKIWCSISLSNRQNMRYPVLIGRKLLKGKFLIDINQKHTGGTSLKKAFTHLTQTTDL